MENNYRNTRDLLIAVLGEKNYDYLMTCPREEFNSIMKGWPVIRVNGMEVEIPTKKDYNRK